MTIVWRREGSPLPDHQRIDVDGGLHLLFPGRVGEEGGEEAGGFGDAGGQQQLVEAEQPVDPDDRGGGDFLGFAELRAVGPDGLEAFGDFPADLLGDEAGLLLALPFPPDEDGAAVGG